jgi:hypothetical protein
MRRLIPALLLAVAVAPAAAQPTIVLPPEPPPPTVAPPSFTLNELVGTGRRLGMGGYGELHFTHQGDTNGVNLRRFVLFAGYRFTDWIRLYSEIEVENATEIELEQAYLELEPWRWLGFRAGLLIVPVGQINLTHEPPTFNSVDRPIVEEVVIPSTWREIGVGIYGRIVTGLNYQLYVVNGLDGDKFNAASGIVGGRGQGREAHINDAAVTGRLEFNRILGLQLAVAFYAGGAGQDVPELGGVKVGLVEADGRFYRWGLELRAEYARVFISDADRITNYLRAQKPTTKPIAAGINGFFFEAGYNVLHRWRRTTHQLIPFLRYEFVDLQASRAQVIAPAQHEPTHYLTVGLAYRPHPQVAFKLDYRAAIKEEETESSALLPGASDENEGEHRVMAGVAFMF